MATVWRGRVERGALVSWRHPNGRTRKAGVVLQVTDDTLTVEVSDHAGTYAFTGGPESFPGLTVDMRAAQLADARQASMIADAAEAVERFGEDELERYAAALTDRDEPWCPPAVESQAGRQGHNLDSEYEEGR